MPENLHFTTRRSFITAMGFSALGLYGVWAGYGAAPLPFSGHDGAEGHQGAAAVPGGHADVAHNASMTPEAFRREHGAFIERFKQPDGSVEPAASRIAAHTMDHHEMSHHEMAHMAHTTHGGDAGQPVDLYLLAFMWGYNPDLLRLRTGVRYRLRMMAEDITHGASFQLGAASRIIRLRPDVVGEQILTFTRPTTVLSYCTAFCGPGHDQMQGKIIVTASDTGGEPS